MLLGVGSAGHHHGELLQGALRRGGELVSCLITIPVGGVGSRVRYLGAGPAVSGQLLDVVPALKTKAARAARLALDAIGAPVVGRLEVECSVATGVGLGSSTCDVVAAIRAVCNAHGIELDAGQVARLAIEAEGAADPIMFDGEMVLFAQRQGLVLESFGSWTPPFAVLSIDTDPGGRGVDTLSLPIPQYTEDELAAFEGMVGRARQAFRQHDPAALAAIATESAALNQRFLPLRWFREIRDLAAKYGALGVQISHSGTVAGVLFDRRSGGGRGLLDDLAARVSALGARPRGLFMTGADH
jgi:uncharacterized protein involved in propanediol utilization